MAIGFCPQFRSGRRLYAYETAGALFAGLILWLMINPIADAEFISDEMLMWIGRVVYPLFINLILIFMTVSAARRLHDAGHSGRLGALCDLSRRKSFSDAVPPAASWRRTAHGLETP